jgi:site-specific recombinase XerD
MRRCSPRAAARQAIEARAGELRQRTELERWAADWARCKRKDSYLPRGEWLGIARQWAAAYGDVAVELPLVDEFLTRSTHPLSPQANRRAVGPFRAVAAAGVLESLGARLVGDACLLLRHLRYICLMSDELVTLRAEPAGGGWRLAGADAARFGLVSDFLGYVADRRYSPATVRAYAFDLLALCRWLLVEGVELAGVTTDVLLRFLAACRTAVPPGQAADVSAVRGGRNVGYAPATGQPQVGGDLGAVRFPGDARSWRGQPGAARQAREDRLGGRAVGAAGASGPSGAAVWAAGPRAAAAAARAGPQRGLGVDGQPADLAGPDDRRVDADLGAAHLRGVGATGQRRGYRDPVARVVGKGDKERRVPVDVEIIGAVQAYLLTERPATESTALFVVAKGPTQGQPLTAAGLRTIFRYHRGKADVAAGHPHALRHTFGTALAEAGVDLAVIQALMGHDHVDSAAAYIHLAPAHVRAAYDDARAVQRQQGAR